jgi:hypothetical protein
MSHAHVRAHACVYTHAFISACVCEWVLLQACIVILLFWVVICPIWSLPPLLANCSDQWQPTSFSVLHIAWGLSWVFEFKMTPFLFLWRMYLLRKTFIQVLVKCSSKCRGELHPYGWASPGSDPLSTFIKHAYCFFIRVSGSIVYVFCIQLCSV